MLGALAASAVAVPAFAEGYPTEAVDGSDIGTIEEYSLYPVYGRGTAGSRPRPFVVNTRVDYQFGAGIDTAGDFSAVRAMGGAGFAFPIGEQFGMAIGAGLNFSGYDFDASPAFGGGEPWKNIYSTMLTAIAQYTFNDQWSVFGGGVMGISAEEGADFGDALTGGGILGAGYRASDNLVVRLGVSVVSQIEDDVAVLPVVMVDWRISDSWRARVGSIDTGASDVAGAGLTYRISDEWSIGGRVSYVHSRFRLDDSGFAPEGVGQDDRFKATLSLSWQPASYVDLSLLGGMVFGGELRIEDQDGDRLFKEDYDPAAFIGARLAWRF